MLAALALILAALSFGFVAAALRAGRRELAALTPIEPAPLVEPLLVVIPARNEAGRLEPTLRALLAEPSAALSVLVVDDHSHDGTAELVERLAATDGRLALLRLEGEPGEGVFGKPRALAAAVAAARARAVLPARALFLDADVVLAPGALGGMLAAQARSGAQALSGVPRLVCETAVEQLFVPAFVSLLTAGTPPSRVHDPDHPAAFLNGQLILLDTEALAAVGGWAAVERTVLEDVGLARLLKASGRVIRLADLRALAATRMYSSFREIEEGFGKNAVALLGRRAWLMGLASLAVSLLPLAALVLALPAVSAGLAALSGAHEGLSGGESALGAAAVTLVAGVLALQLRARRMAGAPRWPVLILPVVYAGVALVLARASVRSWRGAPISWRGRRYVDNAARDGDD
jgi:hypothetical protein